MPGLKVNTNTGPQGAGSPPRPASSGVRTAVPPPAGLSSAGAPATAQASVKTIPSTVQSQPLPPRPPLPTVPSQPSSSSSFSQKPRPQPAPQPPPPAPAAAAEPDRPPVSPITPPLQPLKSTTPIPPPTIPPNFASLGGRAPLTHASHPPTVPSAPPPPVPLDPVDFQDNPDVIALQTTINILLRQKRQAEEDIRKLRDAKDAATQKPLEFARDLAGGQVRQGGAAGENQADLAQEDDSSGSDSDSDSDSDVEMKQEADGEDSLAGNGLKPSAMEASSAKKGKAAASGHSSSSNYNNNGAGASSSKSASAAPPWANLPKAQDIVRCPQINWAQYAIEGEALNKLHNEQLSRPTLGTPALMAANGTFEFTGAANPDDGKRVEGISAPFNPLRDRKPSKGKGPRRGA